jgi:hypothetical protein
LCFEIEISMRSWYFAKNTSVSAQTLSSFYKVYSGTKCQLEIRLFKPFKFYKRRPADLTKTDFSITYQKQPNDHSLERWVLLPRSYPFFSLKVQILLHLINIITLIRLYVHDSVRNPSEIKNTSNSYFYRYRSVSDIITLSYSQEWWREIQKTTLYFRKKNKLI